MTSLKQLVNIFGQQQQNQLKIQEEKSLRTHETETNNKMVREVTMKNDERNRDGKWDESEDENDW